MRSQSQPRGVFAHPRREGLRDRRLVVIDAHVPMPDRDGGSARMDRILAMLCESGWTLTFVPVDGRALAPYTNTLRARGVDVVTNDRETEARIRDAETIWIARPEPAARWLAKARALAPKARIVYDTVDLHHVRERRRDDLTGARSATEATREREAAAIREADVTIVVSENERAIAVALGAKSTSVIPTMQTPIVDPPGYAAREGLLFVGSFDHEPNIDAALYLVREIMPLVRAHAPLGLAIVGSNPPPQIRALRADGIDVRGYVPDLDPLLRRARLALAPLRFGAGLKAKITQSFGYGLPVIGTTVAAEGFDGAARDAMTIADDPDDFAQAILEGYEDEERWNGLAAAARAAAERYAPAAVRSLITEAAGDFFVRST